MAASGAFSGSCHLCIFVAKFQNNVAACQIGIAKEKSGVIIINIRKKLKFAPRKKCVPAGCKSNMKQEKMMYRRIYYGLGRGTGKI